MKRLFSLSLLLLVSGLFIAKAEFLKEEPALSVNVEEGVLWDGIHQPGYDAVIKFYRLNPETPAENVDHFRVSFTREVRISFLEPQPYTYNQTWEVDPDTLKLVKYRQVKKLYVDGEYVKDTTVYENDYKIVGPMTSAFFDYRDSKGQPMGRPDEIKDHGISSMSISEEMYNYFRDLVPDWDPVVVTKDIQHKESLHKAGPPKFFTQKLDRKNSAEISVYGTCMFVKLPGKDEGDNLFLFGGGFGNNPFYIEKEDTDGRKYWTIDNESNHERFRVMFYPDFITFIFGDQQLSYKTDTSEFKKAVDLARARRIFPLPDYDLLWY